MNEVYFNRHHKHLAKGLAILLMVIARMDYHIVGLNIDLSL